jgi:hypothetical protein
MLDVNRRVNLAALLRAASTALFNLEDFIKTLVDFRQLLVRRSFFQATAHNDAPRIITPRVSSDG